MKRSLKMLAMAGLLGAGLNSAPALAQDKGQASGDGNIQYKKTTSYDFEDDTIEGDLTKPDGEYVEARKGVKHSNLIRVREEFKDKVMQSVGEL